MNRIFFLLLMTVVVLSCGQFESQAIGQIDSVFSTPPYVRAGDFSPHQAQPYQMSSSFESKFVPLSSKEVGNLSQFAIPPLSANASVPPFNLNFPSNTAAVNPNPTPSLNPNPLSIVPPQVLSRQPHMTAQRAVVGAPQVPMRLSSRRSVLQYQASTIPALDIKDGKSIQLTSASFPNRSASQVAFQPAGLASAPAVQQTSIRQSTLGLSPPRVSAIPSGNTAYPSTASTNLKTTVCCLPPSAYQNVVGASTSQSAGVTLQNMPPGTYVGRGLIGQPAAYIDGQPLRNLIRYITF